MSVCGEVRVCGGVARWWCGRAADLRRSLVAQQAEAEERIAVVHDERDLGRS